MRPYRRLLRAPVKAMGMGGLSVALVLTVVSCRGAESEAQPASATRQSSPTMLFATRTTPNVGEATPPPAAAAPTLAATAAQAVTTTPPQPTVPRPVELARQNLAERLAVGPDSIDIAEVEEVVWPDTCLGLPAPELCAPGDTPGYQVTLRALGQDYRYHTDEGETFRYAGPGDAPSRPSPPVVLTAAAPDAPVRSPTPTYLVGDVPRVVEVVRQDLAERLAVTPDSIDIVEVEEVVWPDSCLGLPAPELCAPGDTPGYQVTLRAFGQDYRYHTDKNETFRYAGPGDAPSPP